MWRGGWLRCRAKDVKAYVKRNKNDAADAEAICEAVRRPTMRFVQGLAQPQSQVQPNVLELDEPALGVLQRGLHRDDHAGVERPRRALPFRKAAAAW
jgi:transposase